MQQDIHDLKKDFNKELVSANQTADVDALRVKYLGKKGPIQVLMKSLKSFSPDQRPHMGQLVNDLKKDLSLALDARFEKLQNREMKRRLEEQQLDVTLPGRRYFIGAKHPLIQMRDRMTEVLVGMGFSVHDSPEIETEYYNYEGLNYPSDHPARDMQDTFYLTHDILLRSHTTSIQQHVMENRKPPLRVIAAGKCYRNETITARSHVLFHQIDAMYIDRGVTFADLLATKEAFYTKIFGRPIAMRFRPSYFPFVEPGMEVDIACTNCSQKGCSLCKGTGWLEVCGAGMINPHVLEAGGIDPEMYSGYAWGGGVERLCMLLHGIEDIRQFTQNDLRFLSQFKEN